MYYFLAFVILVDFWLLYRNGLLVIKNRELEQRLTAVSELLARQIIKQALEPKNELLNELNEGRNN